MLGANHHGKGLVRIVKVQRRPDEHRVKQFTVQTILHGPVDETFTRGDNAKIVATDTQKNTVYALGRRHDFQSAEEFAIILARHFTSTYPEYVHRAEITVVEDRWERLEGRDSRGRARPHHHAFVKSGPAKGYAFACCGRDGRVQLKGGVRQLTLLKTTQSSFSNFHRDRYTLLPEAEDRLLASAIDATWEYETRFANGSQDWDAVSAAVQKQLVDTFAGPADVGVPSASVQETAYKMGCSAVNNVRGLARITLYLPNIHNIPVNLTPLGMENKDRTGEPDVFVATSEPHGIIECTIEAPGARRSRL